MIKVRRIRAIDALMIALFLLYFPIYLNSTQYTIFLYAKAGISFFGIIFLFPCLKKYKKMSFLNILLCFLTVLPLFLEKVVNFKELVIFIYPFLAFFLFLYIMDSMPVRTLSNLRTCADIIFILYFIVNFMHIFIQRQSGFIPLSNNRNGIQGYCIVCIIIYFIHNDYYQCWTRHPLDVLKIMVFFIAMIISTSTTSLISAGIGLLSIYFYRLFKPKFLILYYAVFFYIFTLSETLPTLFKNFITATLGKSSTFTNRSWRWEFVYEYMRINPWFGKADYVGDVSKFAGYNASSFNPHNGLLSVYLSSGILGIVVFLIFHIELGKNIFKFNLLKRSYIVFLVMFLTSSLMESLFLLSNFEFYLILIVMYVLSMRSSESLCQI